MRETFENRRFRIFFVGTTIAQIAQWLQQFALGWLAVELAVRDGMSDRSSFYIGLLGLARLVPALVFGAFSGVAADRFDRRRVLLTMRTATTILIGIIAALVLSGHATITPIAAIVALVAI